MGGGGRVVPAVLGNIFVIEVDVLDKFKEDHRNVLEKLKKKKYYYFLLNIGSTEYIHTFLIRSSRSSQHKMGQLKKSQERE